MPTGWTFADLAPDDLSVVDEAERELDADLVLVYRETAWGTVDPETIDAEGLHPAELEPAEVRRLQTLETRVGGVMVAYRHDTH